MEKFLHSSSFFIIGARLREDATNIDLSDKLTHSDWQWKARNKHPKMKLSLRWCYSLVTLLLLVSVIDFVIDFLHSNPWSFVENNKDDTCERIEEVMRSIFFNKNYWEQNLGENPQCNAHKKIQAEVHFFMI